MIYEKESSESENSDEYFFGEDGEDWFFGEDGEDFFGEDEFMNDHENNTMLLPQESPLWKEQDEVKVRRDVVLMTTSSSLMFQFHALIIEVVSIKRSM